jgi:DNA-binding response OmpR family regulator
MRILIVEDDKNFSIAQEELPTPVNVEHADDGVERAALHRRAFDFVLLDIKMPRLDGINALRIMKKLSPVPAVTYSGNAGSGEMSESLRAGAIRCFVKPFRIAQLREEIERHFARHAGD